MTPSRIDIRPLSAGDHQFEARRQSAKDPLCHLLWIPALGVSARNYDGFGAALAGAGVSVSVIDYRGVGSSSLRGSRTDNWTYRTLIEQDFPAALDDLPTNVPVLVGGHSIGGQFATLLAARNPERFQGIALVAAGLPYWRHYGTAAAGLLMVAAWVGLVMAIHGYYPGRRYGFAGNEAKGLMRNWLATIRSGEYRFADAEFEADLDRLAISMVGVQMADDRLVPPASMRALAAKTGCDFSEIQIRSRDLSPAAADHFGWMQQPQPVARVLAAQFRGWLNRTGGR